MEIVILVGAALLLVLFVVFLYKVSFKIGKKVSDKLPVSDNYPSKGFKAPNIRQEIYSSFKLRLGAYLIDYIAISILLLIIELLLIFLGVPAGLFVANSALMGILLYCLVDVAYNTLFLSLWSSTPGKRLYGLEVQNEDEEKLTSGQAFKRSLWRLWSMAVFGSGYWYMNKNKKGQALHDSKMKMVVVSKKRKNYVLPVILSLLGLALWFYSRVH